MTGQDPLEEVRRLCRQVHGKHPMTAADERHVRDHYEPVTDPGLLEAMAARSLPLPSYLLPDGTPMAPADVAAPAEWAGGREYLHAWFVAHWPAEEQQAADREWAAYLDGRHVHLRSVTPVGIRTFARLTEQADAAVARLRDDPRDHVAKGSLAEAVDRLDGLLSASTEHDRLRLGGPTPRDRWVDGLRADHLGHTDPELPIRTERLVLRRREDRDTDDLLRIYGDPEVARYLLRDPMDRLELEDHLRRRSGPGAAETFGVAVELDGRVVGEVVLIFRGATQAETGWTVDPAVGGSGIATEACRALLDVGFGHFGLHRVYAELDARNTASARLCERLGMRREALRIRDYWSKGEWTDTLQYAVLASEWPTGGN